MTFNLPPATLTPLDAIPEHANGEIDTSAKLEQLFARAAGSHRSLQEYAALVTDGLSHVYAAAIASGDLSVSVRALRELRGLLQFHALVDEERLQQHPGWRQAETPRDPIFGLERLLVAQLVDDASEADAAKEELIRARNQ